MKKIPEIKKTHLDNSRSIKKLAVPKPSICFSFKYFDSTDEEVCPPLFHETYTQKLMERLKDLSTWNFVDLVQNGSKSLRFHKHDWSRTSRPKGFQHLNEELRDYEGYQFEVSANKYGRVHGFILDHVFYIVWLDKDHRVIPLK